jgi:hypothetical protein
MGANSAAFGTGTQVASDSGFVVGKYNESKDNLLFAVGKGTSDSVRENAVEVIKGNGSSVPDIINLQNSSIYFKNSSITTNLSDTKDIVFGNSSGSLTINLTDGIHLEASSGKKIVVGYPSDSQS